MSEPTPVVDRLMTHADAARMAQSVLGESMIDMRAIAACVGVTYRCVQAWREQGLLPPPDFAMGRVVRWRRSAISAWIESRSAAGGGP